MRTARPAHRIRCHAAPSSSTHHPPAACLVELYNVRVARQPHVVQNLILHILINLRQRRARAGKLEPRHCQPGGSSLRGTWRPTYAGGWAGACKAWSSEAGTQPTPLEWPKDSLPLPRDLCKRHWGRCQQHQTANSRQGNCGNGAAGAGCTHAGAAPHVLDRHQPAAGALAHQLDSSLHALAQVRHLQGRAAGPTVSSGYAAATATATAGHDGGWQAAPLTQS